jgi:hypothetical protein
MKTMYFKIFVLTAVLYSCTSKTENQASEAEWAEMESFHDLMAAAYHPVYDSSNLAPARELAGKLAESAASWSQAELPEKVNNDNVRNTLIILRDSSASFSAAVAAGKPDSVLKARITSLHDVFHKLHGAWEGHGHKEH